MSYSSSDLLNEIQQKIPENIKQTKAPSWIDNLKSQFQLNQLANNKWICGAVVFLIVFLLLLILRPPFLFVTTNNTKQLSWIRVLGVTVIVTAIFILVCQFVI